MIDRQAEYMAKSLAPKFPLPYSEIYNIITTYLLDCYCKNRSYNIYELENIISIRCTGLSVNNYIGGI